LLAAKPTERFLKSC